MQQLTTRTGNFPIGFRQGWTDWQKDVDGVIEWSQSNGLSVLDIGGDFVPHLPRLKEAGMRIGTADLKSWNKMISEDPADLESFLDENRSHFEHCQTYGVTNYFAVMLPKDPQKSRAQNFDLMMRAMAPLSQLLEEFEGRLVIEGWPGPGALCCTPDGYRAALKDSSDRIGINYDPSHLIRMGIDPLRFLKEFKSRVFHAHGKDCQILAEDVYEFGTEQPATFKEHYGFGAASWRYTIPGHGVTPWPDVLNELVSVNYQGAISIELEDQNFNGSEAGEKAGILAGSQILSSY